MKPFFSVVIPTYNSAQRVLNAINSVKKQTFQSYEIIIIDDGSTDETKSLIVPFLNSKVHYIYQKNQGVAAARNKGILLSNGEYICFLDADDEFMPNKLEVFYNYCLLGYTFLFSDALYIDEVLKTSYYFSENVEIYQGKCLQKLMMNNFIVASTVCIRKTLLDNLYFNTSSFVEDYDLWLKLAHNNSLFYIADQLTCYHIHSTNQSKNIYLTISSLTKVYLKWSLVSWTAVKQFVRYGFLSLIYLIQFELFKFLCKYKKTRQRTKQ